MCSNGSISQILLILQYYPIIWDRIQDLVEPKMLENYTAKTLNCFAAVYGMNIAPSKY